MNAARIAAVGALTLALLWPAAVHAQEVTPTPVPPPAGPSAEGIGAAVGNAILGGLGDALGRISGAQAAGLFVKALGWVGQQWAAQAESGAGQSNVLTHWSPELTTGNPVIAGLHAAGNFLAYSLVAVVVAVVGLSLLLQQVEAREALWLVGPRLVIALSLVATAPGWMGSLLSLSEAMGAAFGGAQTLQVASAGAGIDPNTAAGVLLLVNAVMALVLLTARLLAHGLFDLLYVLAGPALLCWVIPQAKGYFARWLGLLVALLIGLPVTVVALRIGSGMLAQTVASPGAGSSNGLLTAAVALSSLILATAAPGLVGVGVLSHGFGVGRLLGQTRRVAALATGGRAGAVATRANTPTTLPAERSTRLETTAPITPLAAPEASRRPALPALVELAPLEGD